MSAPRLPPLRAMTADAQVDKQVVLQVDLQDDDIEADVGQLDQVAVEAASTRRASVTSWCIWVTSAPGSG